MRRGGSYAGKMMSGAHNAYHIAGLQAKAGELGWYRGDIPAPMRRGVFCFLGFVQEERAGRRAGA